MKKFVQIGAGSANLDKNFEDGFTTFIKKNNQDSEIYIVEANSIHIKKLKKSWKRNKKAKIFNFAIIPDNNKLKEMVFYYCEKDSPDFQIFSNSKKFVKKHFNNGKILKKIVKCKSLSSFLNENSLKKIEFLSLDIEGMDYEVLMNLSLKKFNIKNISFEHLHLSFLQKLSIVYKLTSHNYYYSGLGFDVRKSDWMFSKNFKKHILMTFLLPFTPRRIWKRYSFSSLIKS